MAVKDVASWFGYLKSDEDRPRRDKNRLEPQREAIARWANRHGFHDVEIVSEIGFPPQSPMGSRSVGQELLGRVKLGDGIVAARFDRLFGAPDDAHRVLSLAREHGFHVRALDFAGGGRNLEESETLLTVLLAVSAGTPYRRGLRIRGVKEREAEIGRFRGGAVPFGFRVEADGRLVADEAQQRFLAELHHMASGKFSLRDMAQVARERGFRLSHAGIGKILDHAREK